MSKWVKKKKENNEGPAVVRKMKAQDEKLWIVEACSAWTVEFSYASLLKGLSNTSQTLHTAQREHFQHAIIDILIQIISASELWRVIKTAVKDMRMNRSMSLRK